MKQILKSNTLLIVPIILLLTSGTYFLIGEIIFYNSNGFNTNNFYIHFMYFIIGIIFFFIFANIRCINLKYLGFFTYLLGILILAFYFIFSKNNIWISLFFLDIHPLTLATVSFIISYASFIKNTHSSHYIYLFLFLFFPCLIMTLLPNSLLYIIILIISFISMLICFFRNSDLHLNSHYSLYIIITLIFLAIFLYVIIFLCFPSNLQEIQIFFSPEIDPVGIGYIQSMVKDSLSSINFIGISDLIGSNKCILPLGPNSPLGDYTLLFMAERFGLLFVLSFLLIPLFFYIILIKRLSAYIDIYSRLLLLGFIIFFISQTVYTILMNLGFPSTFSYIPFLSISNFNIVLDLSVFGFILNILNKNT
ncbi:MAG: FtsW/RodA/SpoVE family cell cycle protein [Romboutsia sp.]|uniref:FtsW/RodA/SpoVE family cell cycle protein n=1 Tax=Romboutsia sp. TaxID=1965302 RepID=UPI003F41AFE4